MRFFHRIQEVDSCADMLVSMNQRGPIPESIWSDVMEGYKHARYGLRLRFLAALEQRSPELVERIMKEESGC